MYLGEKLGFVFLVGNKILCFGVKMRFRVFGGKWDFALLVEKLGFFIFGGKYNFMFLTGKRDFMVLTRK